MPYSSAADYHTPPRLTKKEPPDICPPSSKCLLRDRAGEQLLNHQKNRTLQLPLRISSNLFSLISRFEALDSLSTPSKSPSLHPSSSKYSRNSEGSRITLVTPQTRRLSNIFSPSRKSRKAVVEPLCLDRFSASEGPEHNSFVSPSRECANWKGEFRAERLRSINPWRKVGNLGNPHSEHNGNRPAPRKISMPHRLHGGGLESSPGSTVKDNIRLFDGSVDGQPRRRQQQYNLTHGSFTTGPAHSSSEVWRSLQAPQVPVTLSNDKKFKGRDPTACPPELRKAPRRMDIPLFDMRSSQRPVHDAQKLPIESMAEDPFTVQKQISGRTEQYLSPEVSPKMSFNPGAEPHISQSHRLLAASNNNATKETSLLPKSARNKCLRDEEVVRSRLPTTVRAKPLGSIERKISDTIEALFSARSAGEEEKRIRSFHGTNGFGLSFDNGQQKTSKLMPATSSPSPEIRRESKVRNMTILFDGSKNEQHVDKYNSPQSQFSARGKDSLPDPTQRNQLPSRSLIPRLSQVFEDLAAQETLMKNTCLATKDQAFLSEMRNDGKSIKEKLCLFEGPRSVETVEKRGLPNQVSKKAPDPIRFRKLTFEKTANAPAEEIRLSERDPKGIARKFHNDEHQTGLEKQKTGISRWKPFSLSSPTKSTATGMDAGVDFDGASIGAGEMIIKEAECGLKEPKPVRLVEVKRMLWLCREKSGPPVYKGKSRVLHSTRF